MSSTLYSTKAVHRFTFFKLWCAHELCSKLRYVAQDMLTLPGALSAAWRLAGRAHACYCFPFMLCTDIGYLEVTTTDLAKTNRAAMMAAAVLKTGQRKHCVQHTLVMSLHFMIGHSNKCHRPRTSSCHKEQQSGNTVPSTCMWKVA